VTPAVELLTPAIAGLLSGFFVSVPVGPVNVTVINEAFAKGFWRPFLIGLGAVTAEAIYCSIAMLGFQSALARPYVRSALMLASFVVVIVLGFKYLFAQPGFGDRASQLVEHKLEEKLHLHRGYWLGFGMTLGNPMILIVWGTVATFLFAHGWLRPDQASEIAFVGGMIGGGTLWFLLLSEFTSRGHRRFSPRTTQWMSRVTGMFLLVIGILLGTKLVQALAESGFVPSR
jgi:L-lysine exporter family protein LysE/ArgO